MRRHRIPVWILNDAAHVLIRLDIAVGGVDERARLYGIDDGAPRISVQCHLRIEYIVDSLKRVDLAACRPIRRKSIGPKCGPHGALGKESVHNQRLWYSQRVTVQCSH